MKIELLNEDGSIQETVTTEAVPQGKHTISLSDLNTASGNYSVRVTGIDATTGLSINPSAQVVGLVTGFIPGADPRLLLGNREIRPSEITEVNLPASLT